MDTELSDARHRAFRIIAILSVAMSLVLGFWFVQGGRDFVQEGLGLTAQALTVPWAWVMAFVVVVAYSLFTVWAVPLSRELMLERSWLKLLSVWASLTSSTVEEVVFRHLLMDVLADLQAHAVWQVVASAVVFGVAHGLWGWLGGRWRAAVPAMIATTVLGALLAVVYLIADRNVLPAIAAHIGINLVIEPGLMVATVAGLPDDQRTSP